jgi:GGDEF domain-containing protein
MKKKGERLKLQSELKKLKKINLIDCTTGIYNKRYLRARFEIEIAREQNMVSHCP